MHEQWQVHCTSQWGAIDAVDWSCVLCGHHIQNDWASRAKICIKLCIKLGYSSAETIWMVQKAIAMGNWWLAASSWQVAQSCITSSAEFFLQNIRWPRWLSPWFGILRFLPFPKTKITFGRKEISDHRWASGKYDRAADSYWEHCVRSQSAYFEGDRGIIVQSTMSLKCLYFSYYMTGYLLERPSTTH